MPAITMALLKNLTILALLVLVGIPAHAFLTNVDLHDVVRFGSAEDKQSAQSIIDQVNQSPTNFGLPVGITYSKQQLKGVGQFAVSTVLVQNVSANGFDLFLVYSTEKESVLNKVSMNSAGGVLEITKTDLTRNPPTAQIDILNRQLVLFERRSGFLKYAPVSLGALVNISLGDLNSGFKSLSPTFARTVLSRSKSELSRQEPAYYKGRPFLRIVDLDQAAYGGFTAFGLHYQIGDVFERGFISNGCFRLRDTDLYELSTMVFLSKKNGVPLSVISSSTAGIRHPYPMLNSWYNTPRTTVGPRGKVELLTEEHGLYIFDKVVGQPAALLGGI